MASFTSGTVVVYDAQPSLSGLSGASPTAPPVATNALQLLRLGAFATTDDTTTSARPNAEVVAYDKSTARLYVQNTNESLIEIVQLSASGALTKTGQIALKALDGYGAVNSVAVENGLVAVAYANIAGDQPGRVALFDGSGTLLKLLTVGIGPDQITFTPDGTRLLVANEAETAGTVANPIQTIGGVSIIDVSGGGAAATVQSTIGFGALNGAETALRAHGLAIAPGASAANDIEPEYISVSPDGTRAYVTLQEVNGVAIIDLTNPSATSPLAIVPLGAVNHALAGNEFDASDRDNGSNGPSIRIAASPTPIYGLLQPDSIASFTTNGSTYFVTANEGDQRVIGGADDPADVARLSAVPNGQLTPELQALKANPAYARLNVLLRTGDTNGDGIIDQLHTLGGRSISIFKQNADGSVIKVRETGGEFEKIFASIAPDRFNNDQTIAATPDDRSDNKGPEPEGITVGQIDGRTYAFVGLERQSGILVYDVTNPETASFVSYVPPLANSAADLGPEVLKFIAAADNPTGTPLIVSANEVSGQTVPGSNPAVISNGGATLYAALPAGFTQEVRFVPGSLSVSHAEGAAGTSTTYAFTVERTNGTLGTLTFSAGVSGSGASPADAADFGGALPATINGTIAAGQRTTTVTVTVAGDASTERNETFAVTLSGAANSQSGIAATVSQSAGVATGTIVNDDAAPRYTLQLLHMSDGEGATLTPTTAPIMGALIDRFDDQYANTLVLAGGDNFIPGPFLNAGADPSLNAVVGGTTALGRPDIAIYNAFGVATSAFGNHEWDLGSSVLAGAYAPASGWVGAQFPYLSANLDFSGDNFIRGSVVAGGQEASSIKGKVAPSAIVTKGGERIGIVGATTQVLERISSPTGTEVNGFPKAGQPGDNTTEVDNMQLLASQLQPVIDALIAQGVNKVILTSHLQLLSNEQALAPLLRGVDIILAAGSHTRLGDATDMAAAFPGHDATFQGTYPIVTAGADGAPTLIVATDSESTYLGRLVVDFDANGQLVTSSLDAAISGAYASTQATLNTAYGADVGQAFAQGSIGQKVKTITNAVNTVISSKDGNVYGFTNVYLEGDRVFGRSQETNLGDISADANSAALKAIDPALPFVVSLKNGGGIRGSIGSVSDGSNNTAAGLKLPPAANDAAGKPAGGISQLDAENALRFDNKLMVFDTTPQGLLNILNYAAGLAPGNGGFPQIGGLRYSYDPDFAAGQKVQNVALYDGADNLLATVVKGGQVAHDAPSTISVVVLNFTANGGDGYPIKPNGENFRYLLTDGTLSAPVSEALDFVTATPANAVGELKAFQNYLKAEFPTATDAFNIPDTAAAFDLRIENLNARGDAVFQGLFGDLVRDTTSDGGKVFQFYDAFLGRQPDATGLSFWTEAVDDGVALKTIADTFLHSSEHVIKFGNPDALGNGAFVDQLFTSVLGRSADAAGKAFWTGALDAGLSRADVALDFALSPEQLRQTAPTLSAGVFAPDQDAGDAARLFYGVLDRAPDAQGLTFFASGLDAGASPQAVAQAMLASTEYATKFGGLTNAGFVDHLYDGALGRTTAGDAGANYWIAQLNNGASRADIAVAISESPEGVQHHLVDIEAGWHIA